MSDTFDHELAAYESLDMELGDPDEGLGASYDPNYYHQPVAINKLVAETEKSYLIEVKNGFEVWIPKKIIKKLDDNQMLVHWKTFIAIVKNKINNIKQEAA